MRTLRQFVDAKIDQVLGYKGRPYDVKGTISFVLVPPISSPPLEQMRQLILEVDGLFSWRDEGGADSLICMNQGEITTSNPPLPEQICKFSFRPGVNCLKPGQVYAYEKYLAKLGVELTKRAPQDVCEVRCKVDICRTRNFAIRDPYAAET